MDFEIIGFDSLSVAKFHIKFHQFFTEPQFSILRVYTNIEKFGFVCHILKAYKAEHGRMR